MEDRHEIVRRVYAEGPPYFFSVAAPDLVAENAGIMGLTALRKTYLPDLLVQVDETFDAPDDRVVARLTIHASRALDAQRWQGIQIFRFRGDQIAGVFSVHDSLPWLQALGVVPGDLEIERRLDELEIGNG